MENSYKYFKIQIANISRATKDLMTSTVCSVIVLCMK